MSDDVPKVQVLCTLSPLGGVANEGMERFLKLCNFKPELVSASHRFNTGKPNPKKGFDWNSFDSHQILDGP